MGFELRSTSDLIQIASAGGGFRLEAKLRSTHDLIKIAAAAANKGSRLTFSGLNIRSTADLIQIASAGKGCVILEG
jgi:hypothetical protein